MKKKITGEKRFIIGLTTIILLCAVIISVLFIIQEHGVNYKITLRFFDVPQESNCSFQYDVSVGYFKKQVENVTIHYWLQAEDGFIPLYITDGNDYWKINLGSINSSKSVTGIAKIYTSELPPGMYEFWTRLDINSNEDGIGETIARYHAEFYVV